MQEVLTQRRRSREIGADARPPSLTHPSSSLETPSFTTITAEELGLEAKPLAPLGASLESIPLGTALHD